MNLPWIANAATNNNKSTGNFILILRMTYELAKYGARSKNRLLSGSSRGLDWVRSRCHSLCRKAFIVSLKTEGHSTTLISVRDCWGFSKSQEFLPGFLDFGIDFQGFPDYQRVSKGFTMFSKVLKNY